MWIDLHQEAKMQRFDLLVKTPNMEFIVGFQKLRLCQNFTWLKQI